MQHARWPEVVFSLHNYQSTQLSKNVAYTEIFLCMWGFHEKCLRWKYDTAALREGPLLGYIIELFIGVYKSTAMNFCTLLAPNLLYWISHHKVEVVSRGHGETQKHQTRIAFCVWHEFHRLRAEGFCIESFRGTTGWSQYQPDNSEERSRQVQWQLPRRNCCCFLDGQRQAVWKQQEEICDSPTGAGSKITRTGGTLPRRTPEHL